MVFRERDGDEVKGGKFKTLNGIAAALARGGDYFFLPSLDGKLFVCDASACRYVYTAFAKPKAGLYAAPAITDKIAYVADFKGNVYAFNYRTRKVVWEQQTPHGVRAAPVIQGKDLVILSSSGEVTVLKRSTGKVVINYRLSGNFSCAPAVAGSKDLVFASEEGTLYGVGRLTGDIAWEKNVESRITRTPPVKGRAVLVSPNPGELVAFDTRTGDEIFRTKRDKSSRDQAVGATDRIFFVHGQVLSAFAPRSGGMGLAWTFEARSPILSGPVVAGESVYIGDEEGNVYRLEAND